MADLTERLNEAIDDAAYGSSRRAVLIEARDLARQLYEGLGEIADTCDALRENHSQPWLWQIEQKAQTLRDRYEQEAGELKRCPSCGSDNPVCPCGVAPCGGDTPRCCPDPFHGADRPTAAEQEVGK